MGVNFEEKSDSEKCCVLMGFCMFQGVKVGDFAAVTFCMDYKVSLSALK